MCQYRRYIYNKYNHNHYLVDCGKCPSCLQKKASKRATRIRNNTNGLLALFVTLTYDNAGVPFILKSDLAKKLSFVPIYRHCVSRRMRYSSNYDFKTRRRFGKFEVGSLHINYDSIEANNTFEFEFSRLKALKHMPDKVGVCYYPDVQKFLKRLRINLSRKYNINESFTSFQCSEYGGHSHRPHFHLLLFIKPDYEAAFRSAIVESWPFGNYFKSRRFIEVARDAASYVSSYVNSGHRLSSILEDSEVKQKHSCSKAFGVTLDCFSLSSVLEKACRGDLSYVMSKTSNGTEQFYCLPIPKYVINRYFPKFKGFSNLVSSEIVECLQCPKKLYYKYSLDYSKDDLYKVTTRLNNAFHYYSFHTGRNIYDFAIDYVRVWQAYFSTVLKMSYQSVNIARDWLSFYDNGGRLNHFNLSSNLLEYLDYVLCGEYWFEENPNHVLGNVETDLYLTELYHKKTKQKDVTNYVMSVGLGLDV